MKNKLFKKSTGVIFLALLGAIGFWLGKNPRITDETLFVNEADLNFGEIWEKPSIKINLPIKNLNQTTIKISNFSSSCTCTSIYPKSLIIHPNETKTIQVTLDLKNGIIPKNLVNNKYYFEADIIPEINKNNNKHVWTIKGLLKIGLYPNETEIIYSSISEQHKLPIKKLLITANEGITNISCTIDNKALKTVIHADKNNKYLYEVTVYQKTPLSPGRLTNTLVMKGIANSTGEYVEKHIPIYGEVLNDIEAYPNSIELGNKRLGEIANERVAFRSIAGECINVINVYYTNENIKINQIPLGDSNSLLYNIQYKIRKNGRRCETIVFKIKPVNREPVLLPIKMHFHGYNKLDLDRK